MVRKCSQLSQLHHAIICDTVDQTCYCGRNSQVVLGLLVAVLDVYRLITQTGKWPKALLDYIHDGCLLCFSDNKKPSCFVRHI